ncbi:1283_t:CDS:2 [Gigaspora rosea]|nr:1283_t:CDS:2 [Gigaspora rosea]
MDINLKGTIEVLEKIRAITNLALEETKELTHKPITKKTKKIYTEIDNSNNTQLETITKSRILPNYFDLLPPKPNLPASLQELNLATRQSKYPFVTSKIPERRVSDEEKNTYPKKNTENETYIPNESDDEAWKPITEIMNSTKRKTLVSPKTTKPGTYIPTKNDDEAWNLSPKL